MNGLLAIKRVFARQRRDPENLPEPTPGHLLAPLLHVMGERSEYRLLVPIEMKLGLQTPPENASAERIAASHDPFRDDVLRAAGYDPFGQMPFPRIKNSDPTGMYKRIYYALRNSSRNYCQTAKGKKRISRETETKGSTTPLFVKLPSSNRQAAHWALTEAGVAMAARVRTDFQTDNRNVTAYWLDGQLRHANLFDRMERSLAVESKMARERSSGEVRDHLQNFFLVSIRRDAFAGRLSNGEPPTFHQLIDWCVRKAISAFRRYAQEPLTRESRGALTKRERAVGTRCIESMSPNPYQIVSLSEDDEGVQNHVVSRGYLSAPLTDVIDPSAVERMEHRIAWNQGIKRVRDAVRQQKPGNPERYAKIFDAMCGGISQQGLATLENVSKNRAATLMADTRTALRAARNSARFRIILHYICEEPWATFQDLQEDLDGEMPLALLLVDLVGTGLLTTQNGSFYITPAGEQYLERAPSPARYDDTLGIHLFL